MILPATKRTKRKGFACGLAGWLSAEARIRLYFVRLCAQPSIRQNREWDHDREQHNCGSTHMAWFPRLADEGVATVLRRALVAIAGGGLVLGVSGMACRADRSCILDLGRGYASGPFGAAARNRHRAQTGQRRSRHHRGNGDGGRACGRRDAGRDRRRAHVFRRAVARRLRGRPRAPRNDSAARPRSRRPRSATAGMALRRCRSRRSSPAIAF